MPKRFNVLLITLAVLVGAMGWLIGNNISPQQSAIVLKQPSTFIVESNRAPELTLNENESLIRVKVEVIRVIDGDTIEIEGGKRVRYIGIDAPEISSRNALKRCFAEQAAMENRKLVEGKIVELEKDLSETDEYGRLLRYVFAEDILVNEQLVREGYANSWTYPPDIRYQQRLLVAEQQAKEDKRGLWSKVCQH